MTPPDIKLSVVILNFNRLDQTRKTISHLKRILKERRDVEVIAVDNASVDGTLRFLRTQTDWIKLVEIDRNIGIAGLNRGFKQAVGKYILVLDDDSYPYDEQSLDLFIAHLDKYPQTGIVAGNIESESGIRFDTWHLPGKKAEKLPVAFVGCGFAVRKDLFESIGWFPESFFLYQNEIDVAIKVIKCGYDIVYEPRCRVVHTEAAKGRTNWRRVFFPTRNTIWIIRKYFPFPESVYLIFSRLCLGFIRAAQSGEFFWYAKAVKEALTTPILTDHLNPEQRIKIREFWRQNSLWHHIFCKPSWQRLDIS